MFATLSYYFQHMNEMCSVQQKVSGKKYDRDIDVTIMKLTSRHFNDTQRIVVGRYNMKTVRYIEMVLPATNENILQYMLDKFVSKNYKKPKE